MLVIHPRTVARSQPARRRLALGLIAAFASLPGCSSLRLQPRSDPQQTPGATGIPRFSDAVPGQEIPAGWEPWSLHRSKRRTRYVLASDHSTTILQADADRSASGLITRMSVDITPDTLLRWRWRIASLIADADPSVGPRDDAPVRLALAFEGDHASLPVRDRMFAERVKLLGGHDLPYATLMYIWANTAPAGSIIANPHTGRIRKLVVDSGATELGRWRLHERNVDADFRAVFGEAPGRLRAVALMTDTDNTASVARAYYGDVVLDGVR